MLDVIEYIYIPLLLIAALLSLKSFRLSWPYEYKYFSLLLWLMVFTETITLLWSLGLYKTKFWSYTKDNLWLYNILIIPQYLLLLIFYRKVFNRKNNLKWIDAIIISFTILALANIVFIQGILVLNSYTIVTGNLVTLFLAIKYFYDIQKSKEIIHIEKYPVTWILLGIFIDHSANIPNTIGIAYPSLFPYKWAMGFYYLSLLVNCLMFSLFIIAYRCKPPQHN